MKIPLILLLLSAPLGAQTLPGWTLVWSDEFTQADGSAPDPARWGYDLGGGGWGNSELQYYTSSTQNARIESGELVIEAREENLGGYGYTSARLLSKGKFEQAYGRFEARIKVPDGAGLWPAFWTLGNDIDSVGWPQCGEIDIMEFVGRLPNEVFGTIHGPGYSGGNSFGDIHTFAQPVPNAYHTYVVEWEVGEIRWYVDGIHYHTATPADVAPDDWPFDHPFFMILNVAIGGNFGGPVDPALVFPKQMRVDYVRVYEEAVPIVLNPEMLQNGGFETGILAPWTGYSVGGANDLGGYIESASDTYYNGGNPGGAPVETHSGDYVAKVFGDFSGVENYNGFYKEHAAVPGSRWTADGWALSHPQDLITGSNSVWLEVSFRDAAGDIVDLYRSATITSGSVVPGQWTNLPVTMQYDPATYAPLGMVAELTAPTGVTTVRYQSVFQQPLFDGGSVYFDDLSLVELTELVESPLTITPASSGISLGFETVAGTTYQLLVSPDLTTGSWSVIESLVGTGAPVLLTYPMSNVRYFYRLDMSTP